MEEGREKDDSFASFSWWSGSHSRLHQSPWLQATLKELDAKIKTMVDIIQDDGDSFRERAQTFYKKRPELLKILQDLHSSYCSLAEKYDKLRFTVKDFSNDVVLNPKGKSLKVEEEEEEDNNGEEQGKCNFNIQTWEKATELIEDNLKQQNELVRRNEEKREVIKQLRNQVNRLMEENRRLKSFLPNYKLHDMTRRESRGSKLKNLNCIRKFYD